MRFFALDHATRVHRSDSLLFFLTIIPFYPMPFDIVQAFQLEHVRLTDNWIVVSMLLCFNGQ
jgi:hypothetical protein